jgi:AcrR family transcriptional regulator
MRKPQSMGRPRNAAMDEAIRQVTMELLREKGYGRLHLTEVIRRAGVSSASVYRRWPSKRPLVLELGRRALAGTTMPPAPSVRQSLLDLLAVWSRPEAMVFLRSALPALIAEAAHDEDLAAGLRQLLAGPRDQVRAILSRAQPEVPADPGLVLDVLLGGLLGAQATGDAESAGAYHQALVDLVLDGATGDGQHDPSEVG